jgi:hypothetical protein
MSPMDKLKANMKDVERLLKIHEDVGGTEKGRRYGIEVLNRSALLFACANWEAFIEDVAIQSIDHILANATDYNSLPRPILKGVAKKLKEDKNEIKLWQLAGDGWKSIASAYRDQVIREEISPFNTPKPHNIKELFKKLFGIPDICEKWCWQGMSKISASDKLRKLVEVRGALAHRGELEQPITKAFVEDRVGFILRLAVRTSNIARVLVKDEVGSFSWKRARLGTFR